MSRWSGINRILDANLNRAREAARVAEDYARFVLDSAELSEQLKKVRHTLHDVASTIESEGGKLLSARDTPGDVGTRISVEAEKIRKTSTDVAAAALKRLEEALRTIEEFSKTAGTAVAERVEALRYEVYSIESKLFAPKTRLNNVRLCVILTAGLCRGRDITEVAEAAIRGGAEMIQLREKEIGGAEMLESARRLRKVSAQLGALFIVNDRIDIAGACGADGVHLGQSDLPIVEARKLLGSSVVIGATAYSVAEATNAIAGGSDYLGVGTIFSTNTKAVKELAGVEILRAVGACCSIPFFAIGGINAGNVAEIVAVDCRRVAVCSAIIGADDVKAAASDIRRQLD